MAQQQTPQQRAEAMGHTVVDSPPSELSIVERWLCTTCGATVFRNGSKVTGAAVEKTCDAYRAQMEELLGRG